MATPDQIRTKYVTNKDFHKATNQMLAVLESNNISLIELVECATVASMLFHAKHKNDKKVSELSLVPIEGYDNVDALRVDRRDNATDRRAGY